MYDLSNTRKVLEFPANARNSNYGFQVEDMAWRSRSNVTLREHNDKEDLGDLTIFCEKSLKSPFFSLLSELLGQGYVYNWACP